ncbi:MAG: zinc-binding dehydrogenase [Opitutae bacterium]|jgi:mitochondrial enoyl-[acyl-carrier protein] reductase / trans-2-enoyl-CoA reductase|nr:zinc-binding dehydrogenase [Opitutae bacterium]MBT5693134.1 zinc-binding dehydrogenase [Opitutae bacterium]MBT6462425.1 zinc-binding dehydrogenase [Opitutae bacterium]MBT6958660.1 zinc-binding dehydrogenase [Opitutae bacterium]MBT7854159.1 zinc-binding dehydrogenase [Opitutae bacterium]
MKNKSLVFSEHGKPEEVLRLMESELSGPTTGEVGLRMLAASINPSDLGIIGGTYGTLPPLPAVAGLEGIAEIVEKGKEVSTLGLGERVRIPYGIGSWQTNMIAPAKDLVKVPRGIPIEQAATAFVNPPTALLLLQEVTNLEPGDWIIQNAANSAVGIAVIQIARHMGLRTINLVRREELCQPLLELGADIALLDNDDYPKTLDTITNGLKPQLALNSIGGQSAYRLCKTLGRGGIHVTIGAMTGEPTRFPTRYLIFNNIRLTGFWVTRWLEEAGQDTTDATYLKIFDLVEKGIIQTQIETSHPLKEFRQALADNANPRLGKVLFKN